MGTVVFDGFRDPQFKRDMFLYLTRKNPKLLIVGQNPPLEAREQESVCEWLGVDGFEFHPTALDFNGLPRGYFV
jgi:hypothetical protein